MKTFLLIALTALTFACGERNPADVDGINGDAPVVPMTSDPELVNGVAGDQLVETTWSAAVLDYIALKNAFVASDLTTAKVKARDLAVRLGGADMNAMGAAHDAWMQQAIPVQRIAERIANAADLEAAREGFSELTTPMVNAVKVLGDGGRELYVQHCPMAFDHAGANWVSLEREIRNPYFGDKMLTCGKVMEEL